MNEPQATDRCKSCGSMRGAHQPRVEACGIVLVCPLGNTTYVHAPKRSFTGLTPEMQSRILAGGDR
jgi:hypothetical protein